MKCYRCGAEESKFWYPYAFGMTCIPMVTDRAVDRTQYFMLCDICQEAFVRFMRDLPPHRYVREEKEEAKE